MWDHASQNDIAVTGRGKRETPSYDDGSCVTFLRKPKSAKRRDRVSASCGTGREFNKRGEATGIPRRQHTSGGQTAPPPHPDLLPSQTFTRRAREKVAAGEQICLY